MPLPLLFTLPPSSRHEFITLDPSTTPTLKALNKLILAAVAESPNCAEFMSQHKPPARTEPRIQRLRLHWDVKGRDTRIWPEYSILTEANLGPVLEVLERGGVSGVVEVEMLEGGEGEGKGKDGKEGGGGVVVGSEGGE